MTEFLKTLEEHWVGVMVLLAMLLFIMIVFNWLSRIFNWGRYGKTLDHALRSGAQRDLGNAWTDFLVKIITEFRHLLALVIVLIFASALVYAMYAAEGNMDDLATALQVVTATLGGLVGSIIGYYFGESKASALVNTLGNVGAQTGPAPQPTSAPRPAPAPPVNPEAPGRT
ncbi:MAG: hypothetical protein H6590_01240 [Flavobacteriales bacterium]|nr:hypothetical protein [Flavobacteriales bacterium]MCB9178036.1 hypothetical protein [Flavobacteriales bacterium]